MRGYQLAETTEEFLDWAARWSASDPVQLTVRELVRRWGAKRRGYSVVERIQNDLRRHGLTTVPDFEEEWIDNLVRLVPTDGEVRPTHRLQTEDQRGDETAPDVALKVRGLRSASGPLSSVTPDSPLLLAKSIMLRYDFSQLAVMTGERDLRGAVSWESIGKAAIRTPDPNLKSATVPAHVVGIDDDLIANIPRIIDDAFVFVRRADRVVCGIITTADLSLEFARLANPFFLVGEIERRLRRSLGLSFDEKALKAAADPKDSSRVIKSPDDLSLGELIRLIEEPTRWTLLNWTVDRKQFIGALHEIREIRNEIMHFSPDPIDAEDVEKLHHFIKWLRELDPEP
jgi:hypothetical protein